MRTLKLILKYSGLLILVIVIPIVIWWFLPERTPEIKSANGLAALEFIKLGDTEQCVLIRSQDINNPIILFLHGGPGMPMMYMAHEFQRELEQNFTVIQWDRRGAGKT
jgi:pimeloyl-ACP methyl ester carboxylesterase